MRRDGTVIQQVTAGRSGGASAQSPDTSFDPRFTATVEDVRSVNDTVVPAGSSRAARLTHFFAGDHLGTAQMEFSSGGYPVWQGQFGPYGDELDNAPSATYPQQTGNHYKFTGKERDTESGLDYFGARYYASYMGRWMSPDWADKPEAVPYGKLNDPQTLNLYGYVQNNPLSRFDSDGHVAGPNDAHPLGEEEFGSGVGDDFMGHFTDGKKHSFASRTVALNTPASVRQNKTKNYSKPTKVTNAACPSGCWFAGQVASYTLVNKFGEDIQNVSGYLSERVNVVITSDPDNPPLTHGGYTQSPHFLDYIGLVLGTGEGPEVPGYSYLKTSQTFSFKPTGSGTIDLTTKVTQVITSSSSGVVRAGTQVEVP